MSLLGRGGVLIDIDGTVWALEAALARHFGRPDLAAPMRQWGDLGQRCGGEANLRAMMREITTLEVMREHPPFEGVREAVQALVDDGVPCHFVTRRPAADATALGPWLDHFEIPRTRLVARARINKAAYCVEHGLTAAVDDHPETIKQMLEFGVTPLTIAHPYNRAVCRRLNVICESTWATLTPHVRAAVDRASAARPMMARPQ